MGLLRNLGPSPSWKRAFSELALIVVGVLIALAVNAWWSRRQDDARERAYLRQLLVDVQGNEQDIDRVLAQTQGAITALERLVDAFDAAGPLPACDTLSSLIRNSLTYSSVDLRSGTYSALMGTGEVRLIRNDSLRAQVISYASEVEGASARLEQWIPLMWDTAEPLRRRIEYFWRLSRPAGSSEPPPWLECDLEPLRREPEVRAALFAIHLAHRNRRDALEEVGEANRRLRRSLESASGSVRTVSPPPSP
jgi:hypothetical protein